MIRAFAPAKINLALHVTGRRADGYHLLDSLVAFADVGDVLTFEAAETRELTVTGPFAAGVPVGPDNLIWRAADLIAPDIGLTITLEKNLPHGGGIGGGSSDAAATLRALAEMTETALPGPTEILGLGADVPVCLHGSSCRLQGVGDILSPVPNLPDLALVLVSPGIPVATGDCFGALDAIGNPPLDPPDWTDRDKFIDWLSAQRNDLEAPAQRLVPAISDVLAALAAQSGCHLARMSGSGSTCLGLFSDARAAASASDRISAQHPDWWTVSAPVLS